MTINFFPRFVAFSWLSATLCLVLLAPQGHCQRSQAQLEGALNAIDQPAYWQQTAPQNTQQAVPQQQGQINGAGTVMPQASGEGPFSMRNILKTMLGGTSGASSGNGVSGNAAENLQTALNQQQQANDACNTIGGESDKGVKQSLAEQAQNHASASRSASDALYSESCNSKNSELQNMASRARSAADEAQAAADRAQSKANGGGW